MKTVKIELSYTFIYRMIVFLLILAMLGFTASHIAAAYSSEAKAANQQELSFKSVKVSVNDTLWSIAKENYSAEYGTFKEYVQEIMRCNSLSSEDINAGSSLIIPIYISGNPA